MTTRTVLMARCGPNVFVYGGRVTPRTPAPGSRRERPAKPALTYEGIVAKAVLHALTSKRPLTRYPSGAGAKRMLFMRRILPDRQFDRIILRAGGLDGF